ncbi:MAG: Glucosidase YgjK precursor [candidate division TA06 bacterium ADurb.Bin417]|uniref:Glucosidase YgjK n=1 Tax=candidate division TA06 bacterium ADurb.Bin417 TaxID=1852828 RepID=A0A1V5M760_UNCT6|nr:MAG: Glucosidase YgjK precursor [candidate division TA06 bacterium ADurb.Bin417]
MGPGYIAHPAFGHWDLVHACLDLVRFSPELVRDQLRNLFETAGPDGMLPGLSYGPGKRRPDFWANHKLSHPPLWPQAAEEYFRVARDLEFLKECFEFGRRNLAWWEAHRRVAGGGFYYRDILDRTWESGIDDGLRFKTPAERPFACVDATSHLYGYYEMMEKWAGRLELDAAAYREKRVGLAEFIQSEFWDERAGFFHDVGRPGRPKTFEGFLPMAFGAASEAQSIRLHEHLMNESEFYAFHPIPTVALNEPDWSFDMWRGPAWNSRTFWILRGSHRYGHRKEVGEIGLRTLDRTLEHFRASGTIHEFYNSRSIDQSVLVRKGNPAGPCREYLGHNPLNAFFYLVTE